MGIYCGSALSLQIESTDSMISASALITCAINMSHNIAANWADLTADLQFE